MSDNPAWSALMAAQADQGDARLFGTILSLAASDAEKRATIDAAVERGPDALDPLVRQQMADQSLAMGDAKVALALCGDGDALPKQRVEAMTALGQIAEAEAWYLALVARNPLAELPEVEAMIADAKAQTVEDHGSNVIGFAAAAKGLRSAERRADDEERVARTQFSENTPALRFDDVGGLDDVKLQINRRIVTPFKKPSLFAKFRRKAGGGVLLFGPPGCGKTLLARATAGECEARFVNVPVVDVVDKYIGEAERKLAAIFADARRDTPTVLFFDELEALAGSRTGQTNQSQISLVSTFLAEMDGFANNNEGVLILAATNMPWGVDAAFRRPGRFDRIQFVPPPDKAARAAILRIHLSGRPVDPTIDVEALAGLTSGYSGADLENLVNTAVDLAIEESLESGTEHPVSSRHLTAARGEVRATTLEWLTTARNYAKYSNAGGQYDDVAAFLKANGL